MTNKQWQQLLAVIGGEVFDPPPTGFIIDSPWLPGWAGLSIMDYYASERSWLDANLHAVRSFPDTWFLPGFWSEFGMCTEPSAFGARCRWSENDFPHADKVIGRIEDIADLPKPDPATDGLLPFVLKRLEHAADRIAGAGHAIRFAVARGPLNIASFLMGATEFLMAIRTDPQPIARLLETITEFTVDWLRLQKTRFDSIDGILILDDIVGFLGEEDFEASAKPYLARIFKAFEASVRFFHNDAGGLVCAPHLAGLGVNLFNFSHNHSLGQMKELTGGEVTLLGNIPPRDVLASGTPQQVREAVGAALGSVKDRRRLIVSCGGGMPPGVPTENIEAFLQAVEAG